MAKIDELLKELCPGDVKSCSIASLITRKTLKVNSFKSDIDVYAVTNSQGFVLSKSLHDFEIFSDDLSNYNVVETDDFAYNPSRLNIGSIALYKNDTVGAVSPMYIVFSVNKELAIPEYLMLCLRSYSVNHLIDSLKEVGARFRFDFKKWNKIFIPLPPLPIQKHIVEVLDTFTDAISNLEEELALREKQFEFYREQLLSCHDTSNRKMMCELFDMKAGKFISASQISNVKTDVFQYPCYGGNGLRGYVAKNNKDGEYVLVGRQGALCGNVCYVNESFYATEHAVVVADKGCCIPRYTFHLLTFADLNQYKTSGAQPGLSVSRLEKIELYVPSLKRQQEIVEILDTFEAMIANIKEEIALRTKQYEYYREKLLSFGK